MFLNKKQVTNSLWERNCYVDEYKVLMLQQVYYRE